MEDPFSEWTEIKRTVWKTVPAFKLDNTAVLLFVFAITEWDTQMSLIMD
jgi:hypothetical protein